MCYMMCLLMVVRGRARGIVAAADRYRFDRKFLRRGCGGERTSELARARFAIVAHAWLLRARAVAHVPTLSPQHIVDNRALVCGTS